jgi:hypothetical protein
VSSPPSPTGPGPEPGSPRIPDDYADLARRLRTAEDRLYPIAMVDTDRYQRAVRLVGLLAQEFAEIYATLDELALALPGGRERLVVLARAAGIALDGLDRDLVIEAAMSQRFRALLSDRSTELRQRLVAQARAAGLRWAILEEPDSAAWSAGSARWVETHVTTGALMIRAVSADPQTGRLSYRLEVFGGPDPEIGPAQGIRVEEFADRDAWLAAIDEARRAYESESGWA